MLSATPGHIRPIVWNEKIKKYVAYFHVLSWNLHGGAEENFNLFPEGNAS
jgi:hypothetical protein